MEVIFKTCTKCKASFPATTEFFYKNSGGKYGVTPRCKPCVNIDNEAAHKKRLEANPEAVRAQATARAKRSYHANLEVNRERQRKHQEARRADPVKGEIIKSRKRAGGAKLSPEDIDRIRIAQGNQCAICNDPDPTDLDHDHDTGSVRWLLCKHCNRGLGAFRDRPELLRKAAHLLETRDYS